VIEKSTITTLVNEKISGTDLFVVDINISTDNTISIELDADSNVKIEDCIEVSRYIESNLDREAEDFSLDVASAGLGYPLKMPRQYAKNINNDVEVVAKDGKKYKGILVSNNDESFVVEIEKSVKVEGKKKKEIIQENINFKFEDIKTTKIVVSFK